MSNSRVRIEDFNFATILEFAHKDAGSECGNSGTQTTRVGFGVSMAFCNFPLGPVTIQTPNRSAHFTEQGHPTADRLEDTFDAVAAELGVLTNMTRDDICNIRKSFARHNHPDLLPENLRARSTLRMQIANNILDKAIKSSLIDLRSSS